MKLQHLLEKIQTFKENDYSEEVNPEWDKSIPSNVTNNQAIYWGDQEWNLILNIMLGIQKAVKAAAANFNEMEELTEPEFT